MTDAQPAPTRPPRRRGWVILQWLTILTIALVLLAACALGVWIHFAFAIREEGRWRTLPELQTMVQADSGALTELRLLCAPHDRNDREQQRRTELCERLGVFASDGQGWSSQGEPLVVLYLWRRNFTFSSSQVLTLSWLPDRDEGPDGVANPADRRRLLQGRQRLVDGLDPIAAGWPPIRGSARGRGHRPRPTPPGKARLPQPGSLPMMTPGRRLPRPRSPC